MHFVQFAGFGIFAPAHQRLFLLTKPSLKLLQLHGPVPEIIGHSAPLGSRRWKTGNGSGEFTIELLKAVIHMYSVISLNVMVNKLRTFMYRQWVVE